MAKMRTYVVSFTPAERTANGYTTTLTLMASADRHEVQAATLPELESAVRKMAAEFGQTCIPYVGLKDRYERKPTGFDAWRDSIGLIDAPVSEAA